MIVYYINGISTASGYEEGAMQADELDEKRYHTSKVAAYQTAKLLVEDDAEACRQNRMTEDDIQQHVFVKIERLILIRPTAANVCLMLNGVKYIQARQELGVVRPRRKKAL